MPELDKLEEKWRKPYKAVAFAAAFLAALINLVTLSAFIQPISPIVYILLDYGILAAGVYILYFYIPDKALASKQPKFFSELLLPICYGSIYLGSSSLLAMATRTLTLPEAWHGWPRIVLLVGIVAAVFLILCPLIFLRMRDAQVSARRHTEISKRAIDIRLVYIFENWIGGFLFAGTLLLLAYMNLILFIRPGQTFEITTYAGNIILVIAGWAILLKAYEAIREKRQKQMDVVEKIIEDQRFA